MDVNSTATWPWWKFEMQPDDLFTTLHDQYNTLPSAIQGHDAFHSDVCEISREARDSDQFKQMMRARRALRLEELNNALEYSAQQIVGDPALLGNNTRQWPYALQIFRFKSLDALVGYFTSFLPPPGQPDRQPQGWASRYTDTPQTTPPPVGSSATMWTGSMSSRRDARLVAFNAVAAGAIVNDNDAQIIQAAGSGSPA
ncbi:MAG: hypothetical protein M1816_002367 [Peltula sp. TS41687]|nr:MAG: hypothetical protein M1816_002367 [Peltula sp. TS41687]